MAECAPDDGSRLYVGKRAITRSGRTCQRWTCQSPHSHQFVDDSQFPDGSVDAADNYCRNPGGLRQGPWCYTLGEDVIWEYCDISSCRG